MSFALQIIGVTVAGYVALAVLMTALQRHFIYFPATDRPDPQRAGVPEMRTVAFETADGLELFSWYAPAPPGQPTVLHFHGNANHIGHRGKRARAFLDAGLGVMLMEYRGYGGNPGQPTEPGLHADARAALAFLEAESVRPGDIVLIGESLGSGVAVRLAAERAAEGTPVGGVVLEAPYTSVTDIAQMRFPILPVRYLLKDRFESEARIAEIAAPLLIVHGIDDEIIPVRFGKRLFEAARQPKEAAWIDGAMHENLTEYGLDRITLDFIVRHVTAAAAP